jgi:mono/diheme cytochrome c family protein
MPGWKDALSDDQIWTLALLLKHMDKLPAAADAAWKALPAPTPGPATPAKSGG